MSMEMNKIFGAVLLAGLVAMLSGFVAEVLVEPHPLAKNAYMVALPEGQGKAETATAPAASGPEPIAPLLAKADAAAGESAAKVCAACHNFQKGAGAKVGPDLWGVVGRPKAHAEGFAYSDAMKGKGGDWSYEDLNHFIFNPKGFVPGTKMTFAGVKKDQERANIIAYLRSLADTPQPLPQ